MTSSLPLPIGVQTFRDIIEGGYLYVDKTQHIYELAKKSKGVYFLSRPRRFGKSLFLSTLKELFEGNRGLFRGLWIDSSDYGWETHPVIRIDLSLHSVNRADQLEIVLEEQVQQIGRDQGVMVTGIGSQGKLQNLIRQLAVTKTVVVLVDEYDKPIIDNLDDAEEAKRIRDVLKGFYTVLKAMDEFIRFVLLTGVSKFSRVGVFSGLNNLLDLTMVPWFATALGITEEELTHYLGQHMADFAQKQSTTADEIQNQVRYWYNGFCFAGNAKNVYNPFSTLLLFQNHHFSNYWFESGTPTFLIKLIQQREYDIQQVNNLRVEEIAFSTFELENLAIIPLLFQTGYLTIKGYDSKTQVYTLDYPNYEVRNAFLTYLVSAFSHVENSISSSHLWQLIEAAQKNDLDEFFVVFNIFFAQIPYDIQIKQEKYYQTIFYLVFTLLGLRIQAEVRTNRGRIDAVLETADTIFLFEFKLDGTAQSALKQIKANEYYQRYQGTNKKLHLVGVAFDTQQRNVTKWRSEVR